MSDRIIEFPQIHCYQLHKKNNHLYLEIYDDIKEESIMLLFDTYEFLQWIDSEKIAEMKKSLIEQINKI